MDTDEIIRAIVVIIYMGVTLYALTHPDVFLE